MLPITQHIRPLKTLPRLPPRKRHALPTPLIIRIGQPTIIARMHIANVLHLGICQRDLKVLIDGLEQVAQRHWLAVVADDRTPEGGHVADITCHDDRVRFGVGDWVPPDAGHTDDDVVGCQAFRRGGVFRDVPVDQG
jgi:hypothetical protein